MSLLRSRRFSTALVLGLLFLIALSCAIPVLQNATQAPTLTGVQNLIRPTDLGATLIQNKAFPSLSYGIHTFLWWNSATRPRDLERVRQMRFGYVKQIFGWQDIQPDPNLPYNWQEADEVVAEVNYRQLGLVVRIGKPPEWALRTISQSTDVPFALPEFATFCGALAERYKGRVAGYQVWNEPNLAREWNAYAPNAEGYVKLLSACFTAIKEHDPDAVVISAGLAPTGGLTDQAIPDDAFLIELYAAGLANYYDVLGLHAPGYKSTPEMPPDDPSLDGQRWQAFRHVEDMRAIMVANGDGHKQVALLELGWTTDTRETIKDENGNEITNPYRWHAVTEDQQAEYLVRAYEYAAKHWRPWLGLMSMIYIPDPGWTQDNEEYWWAITDTGYDPRMRPAYILLANMPRYIDDQVVPAITDGVNPYTPMPPRQ